MSSKPRIDETLRERIISEPDVILDDTDLMRALIAANERAMGTNIVDMRGIAMDRLETRLDRLDLGMLLMTLSIPTLRVLTFLVHSLFILMHLGARVLDTRSRK